MSLPSNTSRNLNRVDPAVNASSIQPKENTTVLTVLQHVVGFSRAQSLIELSHGVSIDGKKYFTNEAVDVAVGTNIVVNESELVVIDAHLRNLKRLDHKRAHDEQSIQPTRPASDLRT